MPYASSSIMTTAYLIRGGCNPAPHLFSQLLLDQPLPLIEISLSYDHPSNLLADLLAYVTMKPYCKYYKNLPTLLG